MSNMYGAVPTELREFGLRFVAQQQTVDEIISAVTTALGGTTWSGPARMQFEAKWAESFKPNLDLLKVAFDSAGKEAITRAGALEQVMGSTGSA